MKDSSKVIMGATLVMIVGIATLLCLIIIFLAELYCSMLLRRRRRKSKSSFTSTIPVSMAATAIGGTSSEQLRSVTPSLGDFYAQGVLNAPRNLLFPSVQHTVDLEKQHSLRLYDKVFDSPIQEIRSSPDYHTRATAFSLESSPSFVNLAPAKLVYEVPQHHCNGGSYDDDRESSGRCSSKETYIYICNPIYDNDASKVRSSRMLDTPFETPNSSPSFLETNGSSSKIGEEEEEEKHVVQSSSPITTPPLTPMKKLPAEGISITLRDARSLPTSGSESNSNNEVVSSILSSGSPCTTSPSW